MATATGSPLARWRELDGLRALAVTAVFMYHDVHVQLALGYLGVDVFFVLSGFLITTLLVRELRDRGRLDIPAFWLRRVARLVPAVVAVVAITVLVVSLRHGDPGGTRGPTQRAAVPTLLNYVNWVQFHGPTGLFSHMWSLSLEQQFYAVWPLVVVVGGAFAFRRQGDARPVLLWTLATVLAGVQVWRHEYYHRALEGARPPSWWDPTLARVLVADRADMLVWGCLVALLAMRPLGSTGRRLVGAFGSVALVCLLVYVGGSGMKGVGAVARSSFAWVPVEWRPSLVGLLAATSVAMLALAPPWPVRLLATRPLRWLGEISYGLYAWQFFVLLGLPASWWPPDPRLAAIAQAAVLIAVAALSYYVLERPIRRAAARRLALRRAALGPGRHRRATSRPEPPPGAGLTLEKRRA